MSTNAADQCDTRSLRLAMPALTHTNSQDSISSGSYDSDGPLTPPSLDGDMVPSFTFAGLKPTVAEEVILEDIEEIPDLRPHHVSSPSKHSSQQTDYASVSSPNEPCNSISITVWALFLLYALIGKPKPLPCGPPKTFFGYILIVFMAFFYQATLKAIKYLWLAIFTATALAFLLRSGPMLESTTYFAQSASQLVT